MSFDFGNNNINQFKAHSAYKDGSGMGGGGMYFNQRQKRKNQQDDDIFERKSEDNETESFILKENDIPHDNIINKFVNWFRKK